MCALGPGSRTSASRYSDDVGLAHVLADTADSIAMARFRSRDLRVESKPDDTPVTDADTAIEEAIRAALGRARPRDEVQGEEFGFSSGSAGGTRRWVIDPIDGTKNFLRGVPVWATLIGLLDGDEPVAGLVSAPALGRRWWGAKGTGAFAGRHPTAATPLRVSGVSRLADASFSYGSLHSWTDEGLLDPFLRLTRQVWRTRGYGDFYGHMLVAEGAVDVMAEVSLSLWDAAALIPIVSEAGGHTSDLSGNAFTHKSGLVSSNGLLHEEALAALAPEQD